MTPRHFLTALTLALVVGSLTLLGARPAIAEFVSMRSYNYPTYYIRHTSFLGYISEVSAASDEITKADATFQIVPGLADSNCVSFRSKNYPGYFLRHAYFQVFLREYEDSSAFMADATWCPVPGLADATKVSFRAFNWPGYYLRHRNFELWLDLSESCDDVYKADATFEFVSPWSPLEPCEHTTVPNVTDSIPRLAKAEIREAGLKAGLNFDDSCRNNPRNP